MVIMSAITSFAQEGVTAVENPSGQAQSGQTVGFMPVEYDGFWFDVPEGSIITEEYSKVAKYPDGSFGVSATTAHVRGSNQKRALEVCKAAAGQMRLANAKVGKYSVNGLKGALASGTIEGQTVTIVVLPANDKELTTVVIATPARSEWTDKVISSIRKK